MNNKDYLGGRLGMAFFEEKKVEATRIIELRKLFLVQKLPLKGLESKLVLHFLC
jgi:hypothetical protein